MSFEMIAAADKDQKPTDDEKKKVADWIMKMGSNVLQSVGRIVATQGSRVELPIPQDLETIFENTTILTDAEWNNVCDQVGKRSVLPGATERCKNTAMFGGNYGKMMKEQIKFQLGI